MSNSKTKGTFEPKGKTQEDKDLHLQQVKGLNYQAYVHALEEINSTKKKVENIQDNPSKSTGKDLFEAKIDYALAKANLKVFETMYEEEFGCKIQL